MLGSSNSDTSSHTRFLTRLVFSHVDTPEDEALPWKNIKLCPAPATQLLLISPTFDLLRLLSPVCNAASIFVLFPHFLPDVVEQVRQLLSSNKLSLSSFGLGLGESDSLRRSKCKVFFSRSTGLIFLMRTDPGFLQQITTVLEGCEGLVSASFGATWQEGLPKAGAAHSLTSRAELYAGFIRGLSRQISTLQLVFYCKAMRPHHIKSMFTRLDWPIIVQALSGRGRERLERLSFCVVGDHATSAVYQYMRPNIQHAFQGEPLFLNALFCMS